MKPVGKDPLFMREAGQTTDVGKGVRPDQRRERGVNTMQRKTTGALLGTAGLVLWYFPLVMLEGGTFQAGQHIGGIAYLLFMASFGYTVLSWMELHVPRLIAAGLALGICLMFLFQVGHAAGYALYLLILVLAAGVALSWRDHRKAAGTVGLPGQQDRTSLRG